MCVYDVLISDFSCCAKDTPANEDDDAALEKSLTAKETTNVDENEARV